MSNAVIGALRVVFGADTAAFEKGLTRAERKANSFEASMKRLGSKITGIGQTLTTGLTVPIAAAASAFGVAAHQMAQDSRDLFNAAQVAGEGFEKFQRQARAAATVGIEFDKLGDQFKDVRERVGEFVVSGTGPLQDAFDALNGKVKLTVDELRGLSGKDALQLIVDRMEEAKLSTEEMSFVLESLASDTTSLLPLLRDGGKAFDELGSKAAIISDEDREKFEQYLAAQERMSNAVKSLTIALVSSGLIDAMVAVVEKIAAWTERASELSPGLVQLGVGVAAVAAAVGPLLVAIGSVVQFIPALIKGFGLIAGAATPVGAAIAAVAAAGVLIYQNWDRIAPTLQALGARFQEVLGPKLVALVETIKATLTKLWEGPLGTVLRAVASVTLPLLGGAFKLLSEVVVRALGVIIEIVSFGFEQVGNVLTLVAQLLTGDFSGAWQTMARMVDSAVRAVLGVIEAVFPEIKGYLSGLYTETKRWLQEKLGAVFDWVIGKVDDVRKGFFILYDAVVGNSYVPDMVDGIQREFARLDAVMVDPARRATESVTEATREMAIEVSSLLDRLFPEIAEARQQMADLALLDRAGLSDSVRAEARIRLLGGREQQRVGFETGPLAEAQEVEEAAAEMVEAMEDAARDTSIQTVRIAKSFGEMANESIRSISELASAVKGGGFFDILTALTNVGVQLAGAGVFGQGAAARVNSIAGARANGGPVSAGKTYLVGERGPELFTAPTSGRIISNDNMAQQSVKVTVGIDPNNGNVTAYVNGQIAAAAPAIANAGAGMAMDNLRKANARRLA